MKNKTAKIFGMAALAMALTIGTMPVGTLSVSAANDIPVQDESEDSVSMNTESGLTKLSTPTGARWDGWTRKWNPVPEGVEWYTFQLVKDGKHAGEEGLNGNGYEEYAANWSYAINESGTYRFCVRAANDDVEDQYEMSDWSDYSEEKVYVRPSRELDTVLGWWDNATPGVFHWNRVDNAAGYELELYRYNEDKAKYEVCTKVRSYETDFDSMDLRRTLVNGGNGKYAVKVRALSGDIDAIANGVWGDFSEVLDTNNVTINPTAPGASDSEATIQIRAFVARMYTVALGRDAEQAGLDSWSQQLINHTNDGAGLARGFICSAEFINKNLDNDAYINTLYRTFFDREPDAGGKANWLSMLNKGTKRNEVLAGFVNSQEFANLCDKYGIARGTLEGDGSSTYNAGVRNYVLRMYTKCLERDGDTLGVEDWSHRINTKAMSPEAVAKSFFSSQEFLNKNLSNEDYVETLYQTFMDRASDAAGKADWVGRLNSGVSRQTVLEGFSRSPEFAKIIASFGL